MNYMLPTGKKKGKMNSMLPTSEFRSLNNAGLLICAVVSVQACLQTATDGPMSMVMTEPWHDPPFLKKNALAYWC